LSASVNWVPVPEVPPPRSVVWFPTESRSCQVEPDCVVLSVTVREYIELPVPFFTSSQDVRTAPLFASMMVCRRLGVWSALVPSVTTSQASRGAPTPAQMTSSPSFRVGA
jgi:hypothetical protein